MVLRPAVTRKDVAALAGVSPGAVSIVLCNQPGHRIPDRTRQRIRAAALHLGYRPNRMARALASGKTHNIGVVLYGQHNPFKQLYINGVLGPFWDRINRENHRIILDHGSEQAILGGLTRENAVDGLLLMVPYARPCAGLDALLAARFPVVCVGSRPETPYAIDYADVDNRHSGQIAARHLLDHGHRAVAMIAGPTEVSTAARERLEGWRSVLRGAGLPCGDDRVFAGEWAAETGRRAVHALADAGVSFTALLTGNDVIAQGAMDALARMGRHVPRDVSMVGIDAGEPHGTGPVLTSVTRDLDFVGEKAGDLLFRRMEAPDGAPVTLLAAGTLRVGGTVASPGA